MAGIHTFLKEIRIESGLTQEEVADKIGLTRQAISGYESGKRQPGIDILMRLAEVYEVSIETLLYGKKDATEKRSVKRIAILVAVFFFFVANADRVIVHTILCHVPGRRRNCVCESGRSFRKAF